MLGKLSRRTRRKLEEHGTRAVAEVLEVGKRGMTVTHGNDAIIANTEVVLKLRLRVDPPSEPSFEVSTRLRFSQFALPEPGQRLAVIYDPDDHDDLMLDPAAPAGVNIVSGGNGMDLGAILGSVQAAQAQAGDDPHAMAELMRQQFGADVVVTEGATLTPAAPDPISQLERLAELRDKGVLTDAEFEAQKQRILSG